jgi:hypothetical protein
MHRDKFVFTSWHGTYYSQFAYEVPLKNNAFELKKSALLCQLQTFANFLCWRWDFEFPYTWLLFWFWLRTHHSWWVMVVLKKESQVIGRIPHTYVSDHCWDPIETTLHIFGTCLFSQTQCVDSVSIVIFKLAGNSHNVLCPSPVVC